MFFSCLTGKRFLPIRPRPPSTRALTRPSSHDLPQAHDEQYVASERGEQTRRTVIPTAKKIFFDVGRSAAKRERTSVTELSNPEPAEIPEEISKN